MNALDWYSLAVGVGGVLWATVETVRRFEVSGRLRDSLQRLETVLEIVDERGRLLDSLDRERDGLLRANHSLVDKWQKSAAALADERDQARTRLLELSQAAMKLVGATEGAEIGLISDYRLVRQERGNVLEVLKTLTVLKTPEDAR